MFGPNEKMRVRTYTPFLSCTARAFRLRERNVILPVHLLTDRFVSYPFVTLRARYERFVVDIFRLIVIVGYYNPIRETRTTSTYIADGYRKRIRPGYLRRLWFAKTIIVTKRSVLLFRRREFRARDTRGTNCRVTRHTHTHTHTRRKVFSVSVRRRGTSCRKAKILQLRYEIRASFR